MTVPACRLQPGQLTAETDIVWLLPIDTLDYVRESLDITKRRSGKPPYHGHGRLVGYANLHPSTRATRDSGRYDRRIFWLLPTDRSEDQDSPYTVGAPLEAVDPRTVRPGEPGRLSERAWGGPLPDGTATTAQGPACVNSSKFEGAAGTPSTSPAP
ncbi:DUF6009 family protein [Streptomyces sp. NPDC059802]|uniref:DUF6009 family protein n=1 Tax=Streptomyces sp. NPDC059802 TaxID=3346952 RepID=UPI003663D65E